MDNQDIFLLKSTFTPKGDQESAIKKIIEGFSKSKEQVLMGVTGSGKTFTMANIIQNLQKKTLIMVQNKTLAGQLYAELKNFFPDNNVEYFISNFDYYQPEAFLPSKNLYIEKTGKQNNEINMFRLSAYNSLVSSKGTIVVASVAAIFASFSPEIYKSLLFFISVNIKMKRVFFIKKLITNGYRRVSGALKTGTFSVQGTVFNIMFSDNDIEYYKIDLFNNIVNKITKRIFLTDKIVKKLEELLIFPGSDFIYDEKQLKQSLKRIRIELKERIKYFEVRDKILEKQRLSARVNQDIENLTEFGITDGIENYSCHLELRKRGTPPFTLVDYFGRDWLLIIDESHITIPQINGMYNTDYSRKLSLVKYGFRLPSAMDNRPLKFPEFRNLLDKILYVSATPSSYELEIVKNKPVKQIIRPTGLLDPIIKIYKKKDQIFRIMKILKNCINKNERVLILTLTIKMAEELTNFFEEKEIKIAFLHNKLKSLERLIVLNSLRRGEIDCIVGINLLREGIDLPEVSTVIILDGDRAGFLRNDKSLIQIIGRATRNANGIVYIFADKETAAIKKAVSETEQRRKIQELYNIKHKIIPKTIIKPIFSIQNEDILKDKIFAKGNLKLSKKQQKKLVMDMEQKMLEAAKNLDFERAAKYRDLIYKINI